MTATIITCISLLCFSVPLAAPSAQDRRSASEDEVPAALNFKMNSIDGEEVNLGDYHGKVVLIVNVASRCGLTPQYAGLQSLHERYSEQGLAILGFPCNQFRGQEPGTDAEIKEFCTTEYNVQFDLFSKIEVNGSDAAPLYKHLTSLETEPQGAGPISWNFEKFLIDRQGQVIARFTPRTRPDDPQFVAAIEKALAER